MNKQRIEEMEKREAAAYARTPADATEIEEWQAEQVWLEDEGFAQYDKASQHKVVTASGGTEVMEEGLKRAAAIRHELEGRDHSDSTQDVIEDRQQ